MLKRQVELVFKLKGLDIKTIQQPIRGVMIWAPMTSLLVTTS
jgi:hypothetical protein